MKGFITRQRFKRRLGTIREDGDEGPLRTVDDILPEAFAVCRGAVRSLGMKAFPRATNRRCGTSSRKNR